MRKLLLKKGLVIGILTALVLLNFIPAIDSISISLEKQFDIIYSKDEEYTNYQCFDTYRNSYDIKRNRLQYNLPEIRLYDYFNHRVSKYDLEKEKSTYRELESEGLIDYGDYTPHEPIRIYGDDDFTEENGITGGNGTASDPYTIEGWEIDTTEFAAIYITDTTSYFVIRNCLLKNATYGIYLFEVPVGSITDCYILLNSIGIDLFLSSNIVLRNNTLYDNDYGLEIFGVEIIHYYHDFDTSNTIDDKPVYYLINESGIIFDENDIIGFLGLVGCEDILVSGVTISNSRDGVLLVDTSNSIISSSTFIDCYFGISFFESVNNSILDCNLFSASLYLINSSNNLFRNNSISDIVGVGVFGETLDDYYQDMDTSNSVNGKPVYYLVEMEDKVFKESDVGFLALVNCKNMIVENVNVVGNWFGMLIAGTKAILSNCETSNNDIGLFVFGECDLEINGFTTFDNNFGGILHHASNVELIDCDIAGNIGCVQGFRSHDVTIKKCSFKESLYNAVVLLYSWNFNIKNNDFSLDNGYCIILSGNCRKNTICSNNIKGECGITVDLGSHNNTICYNTFNNSNFCGINIFKSDDNNIHHNSIHDIDSDENAAGIMVYRSEGCKIHRNNIYDNIRGLEAAYCTEVDAINNWWGSEDGPGGIGPGSGDSIEVTESTVLFEPWLKRPAISKNLQNNINSQQFSVSFAQWFLVRFPILQKLLIFFNI